MKRAIASAAWGLALFMTPALADDATLAQRAATQIRAAFPSVTVTVVDPLTLKLTAQGQPDLQLNLDRIDRFCAHATTTECDSTLHDFIAKTGPMMMETKPGPSRDALRAVVRASSYAGDLRRLVSQGEKKDTLVAVSLTTDLTVLCYFDLPTTMRPAMHLDLAPLGLTDEEALRVCKANVRNALQPLDDTQAPGAGQFGELQGDSYASSYLALHDDWKGLADKLNGHLIVAVPDADLVIFAADTGPDAEKNFGALVADAYAKAERQISPSVYRWTPVGWDIVTP